MSIVTKKIDTQKISQLLKKFGYTPKEIATFSKDGSYPITELMGDRLLIRILIHILWYRDYTKFWKKYSTFPHKKYEDSGKTINNTVFMTGFFPGCAGPVERYAAFRKKYPTLALTILAGFPQCFFQESVDSEFKNFRNNPNSSDIAAAYALLCSKMNGERASFAEYLRFCDDLFRKFPTIRRKSFYTRSIDLARELSQVQHKCDDVQYALNPQTLTAPLTGDVNNGPMHKITRDYASLGDLRFARVNIWQQLAGIVPFNLDDKSKYIDMRKKWIEVLEPQIEEEKKNQNHAYVLTVSPLMIGYMLTEFIRETNRKRHLGIQNKNNMPLWYLKLFSEELLKNYRPLLEEKIDKFPTMTNAGMVKIMSHTSRILYPAEQFTWMENQINKHTMITTLELYYWLDN